MPGGDGTGPMGMGPMTGRGAGYCAGFEVPGYANPVPRRYVGSAGPAAGPNEAGVPAGYPVYGARPARGVGRGMGRGRGRMGWGR